MNFETLADLEKIGMPVVHGMEEQIEFFEKLLKAVEAKRAVIFTQTSSSLKLRVCEEDHLDDRERERCVRLIRRTLVILREGLGYLIATKGCPRYFEFWVECPVSGGLPTHRWTSWGSVYTPEFKQLSAEDFGLAPLNNFQN